MAFILPTLASFERSWLASANHHEHVLSGTSNSFVLSYDDCRSLSRHGSVFIHVLPPESRYREE